MTPVERFHAHLDECAQCEKQPFDLCAIGARLIRLAADFAAKVIGEAGSVTF